jgi:hypothetical protein
MGDGKEREGRKNGTCCYSTLATSRAKPVYATNQSANVSYFETREGNDNSITYTATMWDAKSETGKEREKGV